MSTTTTTSQPTPVTARLAQNLPAIALGPDATLPADIQYMPPGENVITGFKDGSPATVKIKVTEQTASILDGLLQGLRSRAAHGVEDKPFFDFNHDDAAASAHPTKFFWAGDDPSKGGVRVVVDWTEPGKQAVAGRAYRRFSPTFFASENGEVTGAPINMGGLVNKAAFKTIQPIWSRAATIHAKVGEALQRALDTFNDGKEPSRQLTVADLARIGGIDESTMQSILSGEIERPPDARLRAWAEALGISVQSLLGELSEDDSSRGREVQQGDTPPNQAKNMTDQEITALQAENESLKARVKALESDAAITAKDSEINSLKLQIENLNTEIKAHKAERAKAKVQAAIQAGKLPPQASALHAKWADLLQQDERNSELLDALPVQAALSTLVIASSATTSTTNAGADTADGFVSLYRAKCSEGKSRAQALDIAMAERPKAYHAWREAGGKPGL